MEILARDIENVKWKVKRSEDWKTFFEQESSLQRQVSRRKCHCALFIQQENILDHELAVFPLDDLNPHINIYIDMFVGSQQSLNKSEHDGS